MRTQFLAPDLQGFADSLPALAGCALAAAPVQDFCARLFAEEQQAMATMVTQRRHAFSSGRHCAHLAQQLLGLPAAPVGRRQRMPVWPPPSVGSITHSRVLAAALASQNHRGVGIDLETNGRVGGRLLSRILTADEISSLDSLPETAASVLFSAKEAGYKAIYPIGREYIGFMQAEVELSSGDGANRGSFRIRYLGDHAPNKALNSGSGYWTIQGQHVMTIFVIP